MKFKNATLIALVGSIILTIIKFANLISINGVGFQLIGVNIFLFHLFEFIGFLMLSIFFFALYKKQN